MFRVQGKVQGGAMVERWQEGIYLGQRFHTGEHVCGQLTDGCVIRSGSIKETDEPVTLELLKQIVGRPCTPSGYDSRHADVARPEPH